MLGEKGFNMYISNNYQIAALTLGFGPKVERRLKQH